MIFRGLARSDLTGILLGHPSQDHTPLLSYEAFCDDYEQYFFDDSNPEGGRRPTGLLDPATVSTIRWRAEGVEACSD